MREVSAKAARGVLEVLDAAKIRYEPLLAGVGLTLEALRAPGARVDWDVFAALVEGAELLGGAALTLDDIGARMLRVPSFQFLRLAGQLLVSPRQLYQVANRLVAPAMLSNITVKHTWLPAGRMVLTGELAAGYRHCEAVFRLCHANALALPRLLDLPPSTIEEQAVSGNRGRLIMVPPASHTIGAKVRRSTRALFAIGDAFRGVARQQAELEGSLDALRTSRHELRQLIERLPDGVLIHRQGVVIWANARVLESLGYERIDDVIGRGLLEFVPPEDRAQLAAAMASAKPHEVNDDWLEYRVLRPDGTTRRLQAGTVQHVDFEGEQARLIVLRDVTEQHRLHDQLALAERMALLGRLAAGVAHEINNPLAYAQASLEVAAREVATLDPERSDLLEESLTRAREGTERVRGIVRDLKVLSRAEDEPSEAVDLPGLLDSTLVLAASAIGPKARVTRHYHDAPRARATRGRLGQLFLNLLLNAADAIPDGAPARHEIRVTIDRDRDGRARVEISDTGIGIAAAHRSRIFDPFFTTKPVGSGTGLGLAICHRIVTQLGGTITFESTPGTGTTFCVTLPAGDSTAVAPSPATHEARRARVLVVDDEPSLLRAIGDLVGETHDIVTASSGRQALDLLRLDRGFDVILADLMMADITGIDLFESVRSDHPGLERRFVFMTGGAFTKRSRDLLANVPNPCIEKPFDGDELLRVISQMGTVSL